MQVFTHRSSVWLQAPLEVVFPYFCEVRNLEDLTPVWLGFQVRTPGNVVMEEGLRIDYRLRLRGIPVRWQSEITTWEPPHLFVDEQRKGPYRLWIHEHRFREQDGRTLAEDFVRYAVPGGRIVDRLLVRRDVSEIFAYRRGRLRALFGPAGCPPGQIAW